MTSKWIAPTTHERTLLAQKCGQKCFLGPVQDKSFPICPSRAGPATSCKINKRGVWAAYLRAKEYASPKMRQRSSSKRSRSKRSSSHSIRKTKKQYNWIAQKALKIYNKI